MSRILLIRHCEATSYEPDAPLTAAGQAAALGLIPRLTDLDVDAIYSSPYIRARATVEPFATHANLNVKIDLRIAERTPSTEWAEDWEVYMRKSFVDLDHRGPGGESMNDILLRGCAALGDIAEQNHEMPAVACHGNWTSALLRVVRPDFGFEGWNTMGKPDLFLLDWQAGAPTAWEQI